MSICLPDSWGTRLIQTLICFICRHARSLLLLEQMLSPMRGLKSFQIPLCPFSYSQHAICFCKVQETSSRVTCWTRLMGFTTCTQFNYLDISFYPPNCDFDCYLSYVVMFISHSQFLFRKKRQTTYTCIQPTFTNTYITTAMIQQVSGALMTSAGKTHFFFFFFFFFVSHI